MTISYPRRQQNLYLGLHVKCPIILPCFNQIWIFSAGLHKSPQSQISPNSFGVCRVDVCSMKDKHATADTGAYRLREHTLKRQNFAHCFQTLNREELGK